MSDSLRTYRTLRAISATDDTGFAANETNWTSAGGSAVRIALAREQTGSVHIIFKGTDAENETMNWCLYAFKGDNCPPEFVAYGTATLGASETGEANEFYADTITITKQDWYRDLVPKAAYQYDLGTGEVAGGGIASILIDMCEFEHLICLMSKGTCATMGADFSYFV